MTVALFSADYKETTGQALVTRRVVESVMPKLGGAVQYVYRPGTGRGALWSWFVAVARLWRDLALRRVTTLYIVCSRSNVGFLRDVPALLAARLGVRVVVHAHGSDIVDLLISRPLSPVARLLYAPATLILPSRHLLAPLTRIRLAGVVVVENFANARLSQSDKESAGALGPLTLLWSSNVMASKGAFDTLAAAAELHERAIPIQVHVVGSVIGDEEMTAAEAQARLKEQERLCRITYHGRVDSKCASAMLAAADVVALPSRYTSECQPLTIIEAMCAGKALIVSDIEALHATVADYPAEVVPVRSVSAIVDALRRLYYEKQGDPTAFAMRRAAPAATSRARFAIERFDEEMTTVLRSAASVVSWDPCHNR